MATLNRQGSLRFRGGKGSHRKFAHPHFAGAVTLSGKDGDDASQLICGALAGVVTALAAQGDKLIALWFEPVGQSGKTALSKCALGHECYSAKKFHGDVCQF